MSSDPPLSPRELRRKKIGYVVKRFPRLSETFIINELLALERMGRSIELFSLTAPEARQQTHLLSRLGIDIHYLPDKEHFAETPIRRRNHAGAIRRTDTLRRAMKEVAGAPLPPFPGKSMTQCAALQMQAAVLAALAGARGIGHLHAHFASDAATVAMLAGRLSAIPWSMTAHAKDIYHRYSERERDRAFLATKLREARFTVTVSDYNKRHLEAIAGGTAEIHRIYNGIDLERIAFHDGEREEGLIVAAGRLVEKKGFIDLIEACALLRDEGVGVRCQLIGEGPERERLERRAEECALGDRIEFMGPVAQCDLLHRVGRAELFVLPCVVGRSGDRDGLPTVLLEAMAVGTPVLSTRVAGIPEMIEHDESGYLTAPGDPRRLAETIRHALQAPRERRRAIAARAREEVERRFDLHVNVRELNALFDTDGPRPSPQEVE